MGKILCTTHNEKGDINYVAGEINFVAEGTGEYEGKAMYASMTVSTLNPETNKYDKKLIRFGFFNKDNSEKPQLADQAKNAKLRVGSFVMIVCGNIEDAGRTTKNGIPIYKATAFAFRFNGRRTFEVTGKDGKAYENNIICGNTGRIYVGDKATYVRIPINTGSYEDQVTDWYTVFFDDGLKDAAGQYIKQGVPICVYTKKVTKEERDGQTSYKTTALDFVVASKPRGMKAEETEEAE